MPLQCKGCEFCTPGAAGTSTAALASAVTAHVSDGKGGGASVTLQSCTPADADDTNVLDCQTFCRRVARLDSAWLGLTRLGLLD